jgi:hypothetical protein
MGGWDGKPSMVGDEGVGAPLLIVTLLRVAVAIVGVTILAVGVLMPFITRNDGIIP